MEKLTREQSIIIKALVLLNKITVELYYFDLYNMEGLQDQGIIEVSAAGYSLPCHAFEITITELGEQLAESVYG